MRTSGAVGRLMLPLTSLITIGDSATSCYVLTGRARERAPAPPEALRDADPGAEPLCACRARARGRGPAGPLEPRDLGLGGYCRLRSLSIRLPASPREGREPLA